MNNPDCMAQIEQISIQMGELSSECENTLKRAEFHCSKHIHRHIENIRSQLQDFNTKSRKEIKQIKKIIKNNDII